MTTQKHGTTIPTNGKKVETTIPVVDIKKVEAPKVELSPLEKSLQRIKEFIEMQNKYNRLLLSSQKLGEFQLQKGEENIQLSLTDENNRKLEFSTQNPEVVTAVIDFIRSTIQDKRKDVEKTLLAAA